MQDFFEARGKTFLYVITPSKPAVYPEALPAGLNCPSKPYDRQHKVAVYRQMLDRNGIHYLDAATLIAEARASYPISMFPRGGIHWNMLAAGLAAQALTDKLNALHESPILTPFTLTWERSFKPQGSDRDLIEILNLMWPDTHYEVPVVSFHSVPPAILPAGTHHRGWRQLPVRARRCARGDRLPSRDQRLVLLGPQALPLSGRHRETAGRGCGGAEGGSSRRSRRDDLRGERGGDAAHGARRAAAEDDRGPVQHGRQSVRG